MILILPSSSAPQSNSKRAFRMTTLLTYEDENYELDVRVRVSYTTTIVIHRVSQIFSWTEFTPGFVVPAVLGAMK